MEMKKLKEGIVVILLFFILATLMQPVQLVSAASSITLDGKFYFEILINGTARINGLFDRNATGPLEIPSHISVGVSEYRVTEIMSGAFLNCISLSSLTLPDTLTNIENNAFDGCSGLTGTLVIPDNVTYIKDSAFRNCSGLTGLKLGNSIRKIEIGAFSGCSGISGTLIIPDSVVDIEESAFSGCISLTDLSLGDNLTTIKNRTFYGCRGLTGTLTLPNSVIDIADYAFSKCSGLTGITLGNNLSTIGAWAFDSCINVERLSLGTGLTAIGYSAFANCSSIAAILSYPAVAPMTGSNVFDGVPTSTLLFAPNKIPGEDSYFSLPWNALMLATVDSIEITKLPLDQEYVVGQPLDLTGLEVMGNYKNGEIVEKTPQPLTRNLPFPSCATLIPSAPMRAASSAKIPMGSPII